MCLLKALEENRRNDMEDCSSDFPVALRFPVAVSVTVFIDANLNNVLTSVRLPVHIFVINTWVLALLPIIVIVHDFDSLKLRSSLFCATNCHDAKTCPGPLLVPMKSRKMMYILCTQGKPKPFPP